MTSCTKPRKKYRPRPVAQNPIELAMRRARKIPAAEIAEVMAPVKASFQAMREGIGSEDQWTILAGSVELALSVELQGVVRGLSGHLKAAESALQGVCRRAMQTGTWQPTALYYQEIEALDTFVLLHKTQLENLSEGEWRRAHDHAEANVRSSGGRVVDINVLVPPAEQLQLLGASNKPSRTSNAQQRMD